MIIPACFTIGLILGSFLNMLIHRLPRGLSLGGRSRCPRCGRPLGPAELVPILSWLVQRGRCRGCRGPIPWRYPAVEALCGGLAAGLWAAFGDWRPTAAWGLVGAAAIAAAAIAWEERRG